LTAAAAHPTDTPSPAGGALLVARDISKRFGALQVLDDVTFQVRRGDAVGVVGPNGAG
jgi:branched-chain amino acid transport system ATP-binding protein